MNLNCLRCGTKAVHLHHRKLRRHGDHSQANLVPLCFRCHDWAHANPAEAYETGWLVRSFDDPATSDWLNAAPDYTPEAKEKMGGASAPVAEEGRDV